MTSGIRLAETLTIKDFIVHPVWRLTMHDDLESGVIACKGLVETYQDCLIGFEAKFSGGDKCWAMAAAIDEKDEVFTQHIAQFTFFNNNLRFPLARYFDPWYRSRGPLALAEFLQLSTEMIFPITYDLRSFILVPSSALVGTIERVKTDPLEPDKIFELISGRRFDSET